MKGKLIKRKMRNTTTRCNCGCKNVLYLTPWDTDFVMIGSEDDRRKTFKTFKGVVVKKSRLLKLLK